jgi:CheY-like chemotaxis protein
LPVSRLELFAELCARLEPTAESSRLIAAPPPAVVLAGRRLLLAEDHPASRDYVREVLIRAGAEVILASDGDAAIARCGDSAFDAVLMDVSMPGRDGLTATKIIRLLTGHATTPIIALTAHAGAEELSACLAAGMSDHLVKPVSPEDLLATLARWLPASAGPIAAPVDRSLLDTALGLARTGDPTLYRRLLTTFADEQRDGPARLAEAAASGDILTLSRIAQGLVEIAPMLGATTLETAALAVLGDGPEASRPSVAALTNALTDTLAAITGVAPPPRPEVAQ